MRGYTGVYDVTPDQQPIIDEFSDFGYEGLYCLIGLSGHGFKLSPAFGWIMSDLITGENKVVTTARSSGCRDSRREARFRAATTSRRSDKNNILWRNRTFNLRVEPSTDSNRIALGKQGTG